MADAIGELLLRIRERQAEAMPPAEIKEGIPPKTPSDLLEGWERW